MNIRKQPLYVRLFFSLGIIMATAPLLISDYVKIPDFFRGFFVGLGLTLEIIALIKINRDKRAESSC